jgi:hypothetical protein
MINSWELKKYTNLDHEIWLFMRELDKLLRIHQVRTSPNTNQFTLVLYEKIKQPPGFFSPKLSRPQRESGVDFLWEAHETLVKFYEHNKFFEPLVEKLASYGYHVACSEFKSEQFTQANKLTITW